METGLNYRITASDPFCRSSSVLTVLSDLLIRMQIFFHFGKIQLYFSGSLMRYPCILDKTFLV